MHFRICESREAVYTVDFSWLNIVTNLIKVVYLQKVCPIVGFIFDPIWILEVAK